MDKRLSEPTIMGLIEEKYFMSRLLFFNQLYDNQNKQID